MLEKEPRRKAVQLAKNGANYAMIVQKLRGMGVDQVTAEMCAQDAVQVEATRQRVYGILILLAGLLIMIGSALAFLFTGRVKLPLSAAMIGLIVSGVGVMTVVNTRRSNRRDPREGF